MPAAALLILRWQAGRARGDALALVLHYQHRAEIEVLVQDAGRDAAFDTLCASAGRVIAANRTFGGLCDWTEAEASQPICQPRMQPA